MQALQRQQRCAAAPGRRGTCCQRLGIVARSSSESQQQASPCRTALASGVLAASLLLSSALAPQPLLQPAHAAPAPILESAYETELDIELEKEKISYKLSQEEIAKKALIAAQKQRLAQEVTMVQTSLQQKLTEQKAGLVSAQKKGDDRRAVELEQAAERIEEQSQQVNKMAAKIGDKLGRAELLERARNAAARQQLDQAAAAARSDINEVVDLYLERSPAGAKVAGK